MDHHNLMLTYTGIKNLAITGGIKTCSTPIRRSALHTIEHGCW